LLKTAIHIFFLSLISFLYIDYIAITSFGIMFSLCLFLFFIIVSIKNLQLGIVLTLFYALTTMEFPRDVLDMYDVLQVTNEATYNVINTVKIGPLTLLVYLFSFNTLLVLYKTKGRFLNEKTFLILFSTMFVSAFFTTLINLLSGQDILSFRLAITNIKWFLLLFMGYIQGYYLYKREYSTTLLKWFFLLPLFFGFRNILFLINDLYSFTPKLDLMNQAYLSLVILLFIIIKGEWGIYKNLFFRFLLFVSLLNFSRAFLIILVFSILTAYLWKFHKKVKFNLSLLLNIFIAITAIGFGLYFFNERMFDFLLWKLNVFDEVFNTSTEMSGSGKVRQYELQNIIYILSQNIYDIFFGKGFFATYDFKAFPMHDVGVIDLKSYSADQLDSGLYYSTHSFSSSILLKYGLFGLSIYILLPLYLSYRLYMNNQHFFFISLPLVLIYSYYWRIEFALLIGLLFGLIKTKEKYEI